MMLLTVTDRVIRLLNTEEGTTPRLLFKTLGFLF